MSGPFDDCEDPSFEDLNPESERLRDEIAAKREEITACYELLDECRTLITDVTVLRSRQPSGMGRSICDDYDTAVALGAIANRGQALVRKIEVRLLPPVGAKRKRSGT